MTPGEPASARIGSDAAAAPERRSAVSDEGLLADQRAYYEARAPEYDDWFWRRGRYDRGPEATAEWFADVEVVRGELSRLPLDGARVLELAPGTGLWTELLAARADSVVGLDASPQMIERCRHRLGPLADHVELRIVDLFGWQPTERFDAVVFCFWISHVPDDRLDAFLERVSRSLEPGGRVFFCDALKTATSTAADHVLPADDQPVMTRRLDDGREFDIIKTYRSDGELTARCAAAGLDVRVSSTPTYFQYGIGRRRRPAANPR